MHKKALVERAISEHGETKFQTKMKQHLNELLSVKLKKKSNMNSQKQRALNKLKLIHFVLLLYTLCIEYVYKIIQH